MLRLPVILLMLTPLMACQSQPLMGSAATSVSDFCLVTDGPIRWSAKDTPETIIQVKKFNATGLKLCSWKPN